MFDELTKAAFWEDGICSFSGFGAGTVSASSHSFQYSRPAEKQRTDSRKGVDFSIDQTLPAGMRKLAGRWNGSMFWFSLDKISERHYRPLMSPHVPTNSYCNVARGCGIIDGADVV